MADRLVVLCMVFCMASCSAPNTQLSFPTAPLSRSAAAWGYDVSQDGVVDFELRLSEDGQLDALAYDDQGDGVFDRVYRMRDVEHGRVPHVIVLLDSIPFEAVAQAHAEGALPAFAPPQKVIPPFPSMSELIFTTLLESPPPAGMVNSHYDPRTGVVESRLLDRIRGQKDPWEQRLHYVMPMFETGKMFLNPPPWFAAEMGRIVDVVEKSPDRVTVVHVVSTAGYLSTHGADALGPILEEVHRLAMQLLYERDGAIDISVLADHGHNLVAPVRVDLEPTLVAAGFHPARRLRTDDDVVIELEGLVNYLGMATRRPQAVADAVLSARDDVKLATWMRGPEVVVRTKQGEANIDRKGSGFSYVSVHGDALGYSTVLDDLRGRGLIDAEGFVDGQVWFEATVDHEYPDAPVRLWNAFHGAAICTPDVLFTFEDGFCGGPSFMEMFIDMRSTHGGLDQDDSATFVMSTTGRVDRPLRTQDVMRTIEPAWDSRVRPGASP